MQLAEKVSVSARTIQNYESGTRKPTKYDVVEKIAAVLGTTPEYLLGQSGMLVVAVESALPEEHKGMVKNEDQDR